MRGHAERLVEAVTHGRQVRAGGFRYGVRTGDWSLSDDLLAILGLRRPDGPWSSDQLFASWHPDDRALCQDRIGVALREGRPCEAFHRVITASGATLSVLTVGDVIHDDPAGPQIVGYLVDMTPMTRRSDLHQAFAGIVAGLVPAEDSRERAALMNRAHGLLMSVLDVDRERARALLDDSAERKGDQAVLVARRLVDHFERGAGITRSMHQLRLEVDDVLDRERSSDTGASPSG